MSRSYCGLYVDAGYLEHAAATRLTGSSYRGGIRVDHAQLIKGLADQIVAHSRLPLLRVNWYDGSAGPGNVASDAQRRIGRLPHVKIRLGRRTPTGEQKGVDVRLGLDLATHARMNNVDVIYLLSGDDDLAEAVEEAQGHGAQVVVLAVPTAHGVPHGLAGHLEQEADEVVLVTTELLDQTVHRAGQIDIQDHAVHSVLKPGPLRAPVPSPPAPPARATPVKPTPASVAAASAEPVNSPLAPAASNSVVYSSTTGGPTRVASSAMTGPIDDTTITAVCENVVKSWKSSSSADDQRAVRAARPSIPPDLDRALLIDLSDAINVYDLDFATRLRLRDTFWSVFDTKG